MGGYPGSMARTRHPIVDPIEPTQAVPAVHPVSTADRREILEAHARILAERFKGRRRAAEAEIPEEETLTERQAREQAEAQARLGAARIVRDWKSRGGRSDP